MTNISLEEMNAVGELLRSSAFDAFELEMEVTSDGEITAIALWTDCTMPIRCTWWGRSAQQTADVELSSEASQCC